MTAFLQAAGLLLRDLASSLLFAAVFSVTHDVVLAAGLGILLGIIQIATQLVRRKPVDMMEWLSLFLVLASGGAAMLTDDPRFVALKPSVVYVILGIAMLKPGWMNRYLPAIVRTVAPDIATWTGFAWAALMFVSALVNAWLATRSDIAVWAAAMASFGIASKAALFIGGFAAIRLTTRRRIRAMGADKRAAVLASTGWTAASP